ncbi:hypothetical protein ACU8WE_20365 [Pseudomonas parakoreensis]
MELIQGQAFGGGVDLRLYLGGALFLARAGDEVDEDDQLAKADTKRFTNTLKASRCKERRARSLPDFSRTKKTGDQRRFFLQPIT